MNFTELYNLIQQNLENLTNITAKGKTIFYQLHLKKNKFILDELEKFLKENPYYKNIHILWTTLIENNPLRKCLNPDCNNYLTRCQQHSQWYQSTEEFKKFISENNPAYKAEVIQKRKDTCLERFGQISYYATDLAKQKLKERNLDTGWKIVQSF